MSTIVFSSIAAKHTGPLTPIERDSEGYYKLIAGGLNVHNSAGAFYVFNDAVQTLFKPGSMLMTRVSRGGLYAELAHPSPLPGQSTNDYIRRILKIDDGNTALHIKSVELEELNQTEGNGKVIRTWCWVKPHGPHKQVAEDKLNNPNINVCLSIRALSKDQYINGKLVKQLSNIVTWDLVTLPGIKQASSFTAVGLESLDMLSIDMGDKESLIETKEDLTNGLQTSLEEDKPCLESVIEILEEGCTEKGNCIIDNW